MKVLNAQQTRKLEAEAVNGTITYLQLMENAGAASARFLCKRFEVSNKRVVVLCGKGNNGGDGFVVARHLCAQGAQVVVVLAEGEPGTDSARAMFEKLEECSVKLVRYWEQPEVLAPMLDATDFVVDAIYGIGFHGAVPEALVPLFVVVKSCSATILSLDIPSGVICDTGAVEGVCIPAAYTVTFTTLKNGHLLQPGKNFCGQTAVVPVGIEASFVEKQASSLEIIETTHVRQTIPVRKPESNKGTYGRLLCVCGSIGMAGAAGMSIRAALRCGVGLIDAALPAPIYPIVASKAMEPVYTLLQLQQDGTYSSASIEAFKQALSKCSACLIGCGIGKGLAAASVLKIVLSESKVPVILDADGINILAEHIDILKDVKVPVILTPHPGEMARLLKTTVQQVQAHRLQAARNFAVKYHVTVVLKGAGTLVATPKGKVYLNTTGNAGMAKGGSGDVLAGMISAFAAQGVSPVKAAVGCVHLHGLAGDRCAQELSQTAMLPTDMIEKLPELFLELEREHH